MQTRRMWPALQRPLKLSSSDQTPNLPPPPATSTTTTTTATTTAATTTTTTITALKTGVGVPFGTGGGSTAKPTN